MVVMVMELTGALKGVACHLGEGHPETLVIVTAAATRVQEVLLCRDRLIL